MQTILDKIHTEASIILCDDTEITKQNLIKEINEISGSSIKVFEKVNDKDTINFSIDEARELVSYQKTTSSDKRYIIINKKFSISRGDSQNALLKILEERNPDTFIIILTESINTILPTVLSRCVTIRTKGEMSISGIKNSILRNKDFKTLMRLLHLENAAERGSISEKYVGDFSKVVL
jgi:DNA polymerase III gamma/tau subunit